MGVSVRRERERQELRQAILGAARELARSGGWQAVSMRKVAEQIEYSAPAIYEYYASKEAILLALTQVGFGLLLDRLRAVSAEQPRERILQLVDGYWAFAMESPELYQVMYGLDGAPISTGEPPAEARAVFALLREAVALYREEPVPPESAQPTGLDGDVEILWATLHGLVSLTMAGRVSGGPERAQRLVRRAVRTLLDQWGE